MTTGRLINFWTLIIVLLVVIIAAGGIVAWARYVPGQPVEISVVPGQELQGDIYVGGEVNNPGFYPLKAGDNVADIIRAA